MQPTITAISASAAASTSAGLADRVASVAISGMVRSGCFFFHSIFFGLFTFHVFVLCRKDRPLGNNYM